MLELISTKHNFDFIAKGKFFLIFSAACLVFSLYMWFSTGDEKFGTDYSGGTEIVVKINQETNAQDLSKFLENAGLQNALVQAFKDSDGEYLIKVKGSADGKLVKDEVSQALKTNFADKYSIIRSDFVGPTIGKELKRAGIIAFTISLIAMLIYITLRFEFAFALGAVVAIFHDVIVTVGIYLLSGREINASTLAAALTIVGYSLNDTIVIFDRVREEMRKKRNYDLTAIINESVNLMLSRTVITSVLTLFSATMLFVFGGGAISDLSFFLLIGLIAGCYSTIFIASPIAIIWHDFSVNRQKHKTLAKA